MSTTEPEARFRRRLENAPRSVRLFLLVAGSFSAVVGFALLVVAVSWPANGWSVFSYLLRHGYMELDNGDPGPGLPGYLAFGVGVVLLFLWWQASGRGHGWLIFGIVVLAVGILLTLLPVRASSENVYGITDHADAYTGKYVEHPSSEWQMLQYLGWRLAGRVIAVIGALLLVARAVVAVVRWWRSHPETRISS